MKIIFSIVALFIALSITPLAEAKVAPTAKPKTVKKAPTKAPAKKSVGTSSIAVTSKMRPNKKAVTVTFGNIKNVKTVYYSLSYTTNGKEEGVSGSFDPLKKTSITREIALGTCSSGVCRYHQNVKNMKLEVSTESPSGQESTKIYSVK